MSIDRKGFRYRLSNVLAWGGSLGGGLLIATLVTIASALLVNGWASNSLKEPMVAGLLVYLGCAVINYLIVGNMRLLPWKDIENQE